MTQNSFGLTRTQKVFVKKETTFGTPAKPAGSDAVDVLSFSATFTRNRVDRTDHRSSRSLIERITAKQSVEWNLECYVIPSGVANQPPDIGGDSTNVGLLQGFFSSYTATAEGLYALQAGQTALPFFTIFAQTEDLYGELLTSAWVNEWRLSGSGGDPPRFTFSGGAENYAMAGTSTAAAAGVNSQSLKVQAADQRSFAADSLINLVGGAANPYLVTARSGATLTIDAAASWASGATITPAQLTPSTTGSPVSGVAGSITVTPDGAEYSQTAINVVDYEITGNNNIQALDDEALTERVTDFVPGWREVSGRIRLKMRKDWVFLMGVRNELVRGGITLTLGDTDTQQLVVTMNDCEFEFEAVDWQDDREAVIVMPFRCLAASAASTENEITLQFT